VPAVCSTRYTFLSIARLAEMGAPSRTETSLLSVFCNENVRAALSYVRACLPRVPGSDRTLPHDLWILASRRRGESRKVAQLEYLSLRDVSGDEALPILL